MTSSESEPTPVSSGREEVNNNGDRVDNHNNNDLVIRDGFPALNLPNGQGPNIDGAEALPRHTVWADSRALTFSPDSLALLRCDAAAVFTARTRDDQEAYSVGTTYFWPCRMPPRCALEALVQSIFEKHTHDLDPSVYVPEQSGAEWWTLVLDDDENDDDIDGDDHDKKNQKDDANSESSEEGDEVGLHFDADYGLEEQAPNLLLHPRLATITYLTDHGAPTMIFDQRSPPPNDAAKATLEGSVGRGWLSRPITGKHVAFDGRLLHGAPATFFPAKEKHSGNKEAINDKLEESEPLAKRPKLSDRPIENARDTNTKRITLLVNIWLNHCPLDAEPLEDETIEQLKTPFVAPNATGKSHEKTNGDRDEDENVLQPVFTWNPSLNLTQPPRMSKVSLQASPDNPAGSEEVVIGGHLVTVHYGASMEDLHRASWYDENDNDANQVVELELGPNVVALHVGDPVNGDDDESL